jgi:UDP:flavonoid glycosyltransferase YjiC (YdhE family)
VTPPPHPVAGEIVNDTLLPSTVDDPRREDTPTIYVPAGSSDQLVAVQLPLAFTRAVERVTPELFFILIVAPGLPLPAKVILVAVVPHARVTLDTGKITGVS